MCVNENLINLHIGLLGETEWVQGRGGGKGTAGSNFPLWPRSRGDFSTFFFFLFLFFLVE